MPLYRKHLRHRAATTFRIVNRDGLYLHDASHVPFTWTDRDAAALAFRTKTAAETFIEEKFVGKTAALQLLGLRIV